MKFSAKPCRNVLNVMPGLTHWFTIGFAPTASTFSPKKIFARSLLPASKTTGTSTLPSSCEISAKNITSSSTAATAKSRAKPSASPTWATKPKKPSRTCWRVWMIVWASVRLTALRCTRSGNLRFQAALCFSFIRQWPENHPHTCENETGPKERPSRQSFPTESPAKCDRAGRCDQRDGLQFRYRHPWHQPVEKQKGERRSDDREIEQAKDCGPGPMKPGGIAIDNPSDNQQRYRSENHLPGCHHRWCEVHSSRFQQHIRECRAGSAEGNPKTAHECKPTVETEQTRANQGHAREGDEGTEQSLPPQRLLGQKPMRKDHSENRD